MTYSNSKQLLQPNRWSCLPTAFAMAINIPVDQLIKEIGHDGSDIINDMKEPDCRRGFHPQEIIPICLRHGYSVTMIERYPEIVYADNQVITININHIQEMMKEHSGVICGEWYKRSQHATYYKGGYVYDGERFYPMDHNRIKIREFFIIKPNHQKTIFEKLREFSLKLSKFTV